MKILKLMPTDVESVRWKRSSYKGEVIIRAEDEKQARELADQKFFDKTENVPYAHTIYPPWTYPELVTCERVDDWHGETDGPVEILYPVNHPVTDRRREAEYLRALAYQAEHQTTDLQQALGGRIHEHLLSQACTEAKQRADVDSRINDWARAVKEKGEPDLLVKIAPGVRKIADELERQAAVAGLAN